MDVASSSRPDGRATDEHRVLDLRLATLARADGSARVSLGPNTMLASFSGPIEVRIRDEKLDKATLEVSHRPLDGIAGISSKTLAMNLTSALSPLLALSSHPRSLVLLTIQSLSAPPLPLLPRPSSYNLSVLEPAAPPPRPLSPLPLSSKALAMTGASLAAMDAGSVGMHGLAIGCCVALRKDGSWVVDPDWDEERDARAVVGVAWAFGWGLGVGTGAKGKNEEVVWIEAEGGLDEDQLDRALDLSRTAARATLAGIRKTMSAGLPVPDSSLDEDAMEA